MGRRQRKQRQLAAKPSRIELLPVELQLAILEHLSSIQDLGNLTDASQIYRHTYLNYQKTVIAHVTQAMLGDGFVEACMLQYWNGYIDTGYTITDTEYERTYYPKKWPRGAYRHIQLKFIHDCDQLAMADIGDQIEHMRRLLTLYDLSEILMFYNGVVKPLSTLFARPGEVSTQELIHRQGQWDSTPEAGSVTPTERQRIIRTLYRYEICCRLYGPSADQERQGEGIVDLGISHAVAMMSDFFGHFDPLENEEIEFVYCGIAFELQKAFNLVRDRNEWWDMLGRWRPWQMFYNWRIRQPFGWWGYTAGAASRGLELVQNIRYGRQTGPEVVARMLVESNPLELHHFMWDALSYMRESYHFRDQFPESWTDEFWR